MVADLAAGSTSSFPGVLTDVGGKLYFQASGNNPVDGNVGTELYVYDPATGVASLVADLNPGTASSNPVLMTEVDIAGGSTINGTGANDLLVGGAGMTR